MKRSNKKLLGWQWCTLLSTTQYTHYYKLPVSGHIVKVDTRTGIGEDQEDHTIGTGTTFKRREYPTLFDQPIKQEDNVYNKPDNNLVITSIAKAAF